MLDKKMKIEPHYLIIRFDPKSGGECKGWVVDDTDSLEVAANYLEGAMSDAADSLYSQLPYDSDVADDGTIMCDESTIYRAGADEQQGDEYSEAPEWNIYTRFTWRDLEYFCRVIRLDFQAFGAEDVTLDALGFIARGRKAENPYKPALPIELDLLSKLAFEWTDASEAAAMETESR